MTKETTYQRLKRENHELMEQLREVCINPTSMKSIIIIARQELLKNQEAMFFMGSGTTHSECFPGLLNCITNDSILKDK